MITERYHTPDLSRYSFLVTGGAGFIGSNLVEYLLKNGAGKVRVLDNFSTGFRANIAEFENNKTFELFEGDIRNLDDCINALQDIDYVSHQAALGSVPRSINNPLTTNDVNITGFLNMLWAIKQNGNIKRMVYAASSSTYGDSKALPKVEDVIGKPLSPYAVTKYVNELYADVFAKTYNLQAIGLRYFNIFGPKQNPAGEYAAVIPLFIKAIHQGIAPFINGDGEQTRDFTYIENAVQANVKAFFAENPEALNQVYNIAVSDQTSIKNAFEILRAIENKNIQPMYRETRPGDIKDSMADISKATALLGYAPKIGFKEGLIKTYHWAKNNYSDSL